MQTSVLGSAAAGARWVVLENLLRQFLGLGVFLVLARLLGPEAFGLLALAGVAVSFLGLFIEGSLGDAIVQRQKLQAGFLDTVFFVAAGLGVVLAIVLFLMAGPVSQMLGQDRLAPLLRLLAPAVALNSLCVVQQAILQRKFAYRAFAIRTGVGIVAGGTTGIAMAFAGYGVMSLVGQQLVQAVVSLLVLWVAASWRPGVSFSRRHLESLARFSLPLIAANFLNFVNRKGDDLLIGVFLGPVALGFYALAYQMLLVLEQLVSRGFDAVGLSTFSRMQDDKVALGEAFLRFTRLAGVVAVPLFLGAAAVAPDALPLIFGDEWWPVVPVFQWLTGAGLLHAVFHFNHAVFKARGRPALSLGVSLINAACNVFVFLLVVQYGVVAVAAGYTVRAWLLAPVGLVLVKGLIGLSIRRYTRQHAVPVLAGLAMTATLVWFAPGSASWAGLAGQIVLGATVYAGLMAITLHDELRQLLAPWLRTTRQVAAN